MLRIFQAETDEHVAQVHTLFIEYAGCVGHDLEFQHFSDELSSLPGSYAPPTGRLLLAAEGDELVGCVALRQQTPEICEMKRLYIREPFRGRGFGRQMAIAVIDAARQIGYKRMRLDTLATMTIPRSLYQSLGFVGVDPYYDNPIPGATFFELELR